VSEEIVVVSGLGRCGSSAMMQMLEAGGMPLYTHTPVFYESKRVLGLPEKSSFLEQAKGKALKILDPQIYQPSPKYAYRFIWMDRNIQQQVKSQRKFLIHRLKRDVPYLKGWEGSLSADRTYALSVLSSLGPVLIVSFEALIGDPLRVAYDVGQYLLGIVDFDTHAASSVIRARESDCLQHMEEINEDKGGK